MKEEKNIDRLFQERFKDFDEQPSPEVWAGIKARLDTKKKRRVIPLWFKVAGVAAVFAVLALLGDFYLSPSGQNIKIVEQPEYTPNENDASLPNNYQNPNRTEDQLVIGNEQYNQDDDTLESNVESEVSVKKQLGNPKETTGFTQSETVDQEEDLLNERPENTKTQNAITENTNEGNQNSNVLKNGKNEPKNANLDPESGKNTNTGFDQNSSKEAVTESDKQDNLLDTEKTLSERITENSSEKSQNSSVVENGQNGSKSANFDPKNEQNKNNIKETIAESNKQEIPANSEKTLPELIAENAAKNQENVENPEIIADENLNQRWALTPNIAPVYYNSFAGSGIDPQFNGNSKDGKINLSYGLQVSYAVADRLTVRSGVNKIDLSYNTNEILLSAGVRAGSIQSINYTKSSELVDVTSGAFLDAGSESPVSNATELPQNRSSTGSLDQSLGYFEVPMEIEYALVERRVGLQLIGGLSTLFLNSNEILFNDGDFSTALGKSNSLNDVSFSTNVGIGLDYKFNDKIKFNLEPIFKYQLNAYKNSVSDFKPYYLGLYTGLSIQF